MEESQAENNPNGASKKFKPFKAFRRIFREGKKTTSKRLSKFSDNTTDKSQGTSVPSVRLNRPLSMSHDSIFAAEIVMPEVKVFGADISDRCLSDEEINAEKDSGKAKVAQLQDQLKLKFGQGKGLPHHVSADVLSSSAPSIIISKDEDMEITPIETAASSSTKFTGNKASMNETETKVDAAENDENKDLDFNIMDNEAPDVLSNVAAYSKISSRPKNRRKGGKPPSMRNLTSAPTFDSVFEQVTEERLVSFNEDDVNEQQDKKDTAEKSGKKSEERKKEEEMTSAPVRKSLSFKNHLGSPMMAPSLGDMKKIKLRKTNSSASAENRPELSAKSATKDDAQKSSKKVEKTTSVPGSKDEKVSTPNSAKSKGKKMNFFSKKDLPKSPTEKKTPTTKKTKSKTKESESKADEEVFKSSKTRENSAEKEAKSSPKEAKKSENLLKVVDKRRRAVSSETEKPKKSAPFKNSSFSGVEDIKLKKVEVKQKERKDSDEVKDKEEEPPQENKFFKLRKVSRSDSGKTKSSVDDKKSPKTSESSEKISSPSSPKKALIPPNFQKNKNSSKKPKEADDKKDEKKSEKSNKQATEPLKSLDSETKPTRPGLKFGPVLTPTKDQSENLLKPEMGKLKPKPEIKSPETEEPQSNNAFPVKLKSTGNSKRLFSTEKNNNNVKAPITDEKNSKAEIIQKPVERKISHNRNNSNNNITLIETVNLNNSSNDLPVKNIAAKTPPKVPKKPTISRPPAKQPNKITKKENLPNVEKENIVALSKTQSDKNTLKKGDESQSDGNAPSWVSLARKRSKKWDSSKMSTIDNNAKEVKTVSTKKVPAAEHEKLSVQTKIEIKTSDENSSHPALRKSRTNQYKSSKSFEDKPSVPPKTLRPVSDEASFSLNPSKPSRSLSFKVPTEQDTTGSPPPWLAIAMKKQKRWGKEEMV